MTKEIETALDRAQDMGLRVDHAEVDFVPFLGFSTRDGYLEWRAVWRTRINALTNTCQQARSAHMRAVSLSRQVCVCTDPEKLAELLEAGKVVSKELMSYGYRDVRREHATSLLALRAASKREAGRQWKAARLSAAA